MSKGLENLTPQINPVTPDYPWGDIKDDTGANDGTDVNRSNHADYHQTFRKWLSMAGLTPNGLPDNVTNGYQYIDALNIIYKKFIGVNVVSANTTLTAAIKNKLINVTGASSDVLIVLPPPSACEEGDTFTILNNGDFSVEVRRPTGGGGGAIELGSGGVTSVFIPSKYDFVELVLDKANFLWYPSQYKNTGSTQPMVLVNSWLAAYSTTPAYKVNGPQVTFSGTLTKAANGTGTIANVPAPSANRKIPVTTFDGTNYLPNFLKITTGGVLSLQTTGGTNVEIYMDGVGYMI